MKNNVVQMTGSLVLAACMLGGSSASAMRMPNWSNISGFGKRVMTYLPTRKSATAFVSYAATSVAAKASLLKSKLHMPVITMAAIKAGAQKAGASVVGFVKPVAVLVMHHPVITSAIVLGLTGSALTYAYFPRIKNQTFSFCKNCSRKKITFGFASKGSVADTSSDHALAQAMQKAEDAQSKVESTTANQIKHNAIVNHMRRVQNGR